MDTGPRLDADEQVAPTPAPPDPGDAGPGLTAPAILAALILALAAITSRANPPPESPEAQARRHQLSGRQTSRTDQPGGVAVPPGDPVWRPRGYLLA
jgi:hypothetical protein